MPEVGVILFTGSAAKRTVETQPSGCVTPRASITRSGSQRLVAPKGVVCGRIARVQEAGQIATNDSRVRKVSTNASELARSRTRGVEYRLQRQAIAHPRGADKWRLNGRGKGLAGA
jgi:hypothetical protein